MASKCRRAAREVLAKCAGDVERDLQSLGPLGSRLRTMTRAVSDTQQMTGEEHARFCVMDTTSALRAVVVLQADAHGFAVDKLGLDTCDKAP